MISTKERTARSFMPVLAVLLFSCLMILGAVSVSAATTVYKGVDYSKVYDYEYYVAHNEYVASHYPDNEYKCLKHFVKYGMKRGQQGCEDFDVISYIYGNQDLRKKYKNNIRKYYKHYMKYGYKQAKRAGTLTGITEMQDYCVIYNGVDYSRVYDYNYYVKKHPEVKQKYGYNDTKVLKYFVTYGMKKAQKGNCEFYVKRYRNANPELKAKWGKKWTKYYTYYAKTGLGNLRVVTTTTEATTTTTTADTSGRKYKNTINGKKTLKTYLQNALVPCGRTLYIWGGGWGDQDASIIGYQKKWQTFFNKHATASYDYKSYRYSYGNGLDCSGFAAWTLYNTLYTTSGQAWLVYQSTTVATQYVNKGWCKYVSGKFKPGDVVSMDGHVWISLGQCSDGSVLLIHSSPQGVQISGTAGRAAQLATYYMKKYFPEWPYAARTVSSGYLNYVHRARWKTIASGHILTDPDGIQSMSAEECMKELLGS